MDTNIATERARPTDVRSVKREPSASSRSESKPVFVLNKGEAPIFVLLLSIRALGGDLGSFRLLAVGGLVTRRRW
jgi:hypothetical protein